MLPHWLDLHVGQFFTACHSGLVAKLYQAWFAVTAYLKLIALFSPTSVILLFASLYHEVLL